MRMCEHTDSYVVIYKNCRQERRAAIDSSHRRHTSHKHTAEKYTTSAFITRTVTTAADTYMSENTTNTDYTTASNIFPHHQRQQPLQWEGAYMFVRSTPPTPSRRQIGLGFRVQPPIHTHLRAEWRDPGEVHPR